MEKDKDRLKMAKNFKDTKLSFDWTVENFIGLTTNLVSPEVSAPSPREKYKWIIWLYPNGIRADPGYVTLALVLNEPLCVALKVDFKVGLVDEKGILREDVCFNRNDYTFEGRLSGDYYCHSKGLIRREHLANEDMNNYFLSNGNLRIRCEIVFEKRVKQKGERGEPLEVIEDLRGALLNGLHSDVVLKVDGKEIRAHRLILALRSPVFRAMFEPNTKESIEGEVDVKEMSHEVLQTIVAFLYTGKIRTESCSFDLLKGADFYDLKSLKAICEQELGSDLTTENAVDTLIASHECNAFTLRDTVIEYISENGKNVKETEKWKKKMTNFPQLMLLLLNKVL